ncbi:hypothetical protein [Streptomyces uncialis]|nr:hypothetical protein OG268_05670 [Streptomyces uncialis]
MSALRIRRDLASPVISPSMSTTLVAHSWGPRKRPMLPWPLSSM